MKAQATMEATGQAIQAAATTHLVIAFIPLAAESFTITVLDTPRNPFVLSARNRIDSHCILVPFRAVFFRFLHDKGKKTMGGIKKLRASEYI